MAVKIIVLVALLTLSVMSLDLMTFDEFIVKFNKNYAVGTAEYAEKKQIFDYNVEQLKKKNCTVCGVTKFFDIPSADFEKNTLTLQIPDAPVSAALPNAGNGTGPMKLSAPRSIDWRLRGVITPIRDQASCGCCWAFASLALAETNLIMKGLASPSVDLSEQYMLKCTPQGDCQGGYLQNALKQIVTYGVPYQSKYPYSPKSTYSGICMGLSNVKISTKKPLSYYDLGDEDIKNLLTTGPLAIAIDSTNWQYYTGGIWKCDPNGDVNHAVLLVGYTDDGKSWIIKNQWGADWGESGYMYVSTDSRYNCKIGTAVHMLSEINIKIFAILCFLVLGFLF